MVPLAKSGGLGDVCGALPRELSQLGVQCTAFLPAYRSVMKSGLHIEPTHITFTVQIAGKHVACRLLRTTLPNSDVTVYLIDQPQYFDRDGFYSDASGEFRDSCERFCFFNRAVAEAIDDLKLAVDVVHCHDWQSGLLPAYIASSYRSYAWTERAKSIMTIHNLAYQGRFWHLDMPMTDLSWDYFNHHQMEFYGDLNLLKTGIVFADQVTTVSPTYAQEITTPEFGCGLEQVLASRGDDLIGIVNGVDYAHWDPATDPHLPKNYTKDDWQTGKRFCKQKVQEELGLRVDPNVPLIGIVSRLADQKGWDLIIPLLLHWGQNQEVQWAILGTGDPRYEKELKNLAAHHPGKIGVSLQFSEALAHRIEAGSDMFLMPSRYEPCGLNQLYSLKYGSVPVVNAVGGLADTVTDTNDATLKDNSATGFACYEYSVSALESTLHKAIEFHLHRQDIWAQIVFNGMAADWSWSQSARKYMEVYQELVQR